MNFEKLAALLAVVFASSYVTAAERIDSYPAADFTSLREQLEEIAFEVDLLEARMAELQSSTAAPQTPSERDELVRHMNKLQAELALLQEQLNGGRIAYVSHDALVSRSGPAYLPRDESGNETSASAFANSVSRETGLAISGFMDAVYEANSAAESGNRAYLNQVEVDLAKDINERAAASLGIIYIDGFRVGAAQISYKIKKETDESASWLTSWTTYAGQFDAPFGEDVSTYTSNLRKSVSVPEVVRHTHGLWNDVGVASKWTTKALSLDAWSMRGFALRSNQDIEHPTDVVNVSGGVRLNANVSSTLRCGASCAYGWLTDGAPAMQMYGAHAVWTPRSWTFKAEGVVLQEQANAAGLDRRGLYVQGVKELGRFFVLSRADFVDGIGYDAQDHYSVGGGAYLGNGLEFRSEYRLHHNEKNSQGLVQIVATF